MGSVITPLTFVIRVLKYMSQNKRPIGTLNDVVKKKCKIFEISMVLCRLKLKIIIFFREQEIALNIDVY